MAYQKLPGIYRKESPAKQTKSGRGNIFTTRGRNQRLVNKHAKTVDALDRLNNEITHLGHGAIKVGQDKAGIKKYSKKKQKLENKMSDQPKRIIGFAKDKRIDVHDDGTYSRRHRTHRGHGAIEIYDEEIIPRRKKR